MACRSPPWPPRSGSAGALCTNGCGGFWRRASGAWRTNLAVGAYRPRLPPQELHALEQYWDNVRWQGVLPRPDRNRPLVDIGRLIRSCGSCPDGAMSLVCHFSHDRLLFQHYLSPAPVVNSLIGTIKETSLKRDIGESSYLAFSCIMLL